MTKEYEDDELNEVVISWDEYQTLTERSQRLYIFEQLILESENWLLDNPENLKVLQSWTCPTVALNFPNLSTPSN